MGHLRVNTTENMKLTEIRRWQQWRAAGYGESMSGLGCRLKAAPASNLEMGCPVASFPADPERLSQPLTLTQVNPGQVRSYKPHHTRYRFSYGSSSLSPASTNQAPSRTGRGLILVVPALPIPSAARDVPFLSLIADERTLQCSLRRDLVLW